MEVCTVQSHRHSSPCRGMDGIHFSMSSASRFSPIASDRRAFIRILFVAPPFIHSSSILVNLSRVVGWSRVITFSVAVDIPSCNPSWYHTAATVHSWFSRSGMCPCTSKPGRRERQITGFIQFFKCYLWLASCNICSIIEIANPQQRTNRPCQSLYPHSCQPSMVTAHWSHGAQILEDRVIGKAPSSMFTA